MGNDFYFAIPMLICFGSAITFLIKWFGTYSEIKRISLSTMIKEGMKGLSYIKKDNPDFTEDEAKILNRYHNLIYLFMLSGVSLAITFLIVKSL